MSKKSTKALASATLMSLVLTTALSAGPVQAAAGKVTRTSGSDRYATAASVATANWTTSDDVVLVSGEGYADAVSASALAKKLNAPILLTTAGSLSTDTQNALTTLKAKNIYVVGGNASVSSSVRSDLKKNYNLIELGGANRYETNAAVAQKLVDLGVKPDEVIMVGGEGFSDALSIAPIAAAKGQILLLGVNNADSMKSVIDFVNKNGSKVTVVGTENVINSDIYNKVKGTNRVSGGADRFDTNMKVLAAYKDTVKMDKLYVANATGDGYADALVASAVAGKTGSPLVLVDSDGASATTNAIKYIKDNAKSTTDLNVIGGTGVVSTNVEDQINNIFKSNPTPDGTVKSIQVVGLNQIRVDFGSNVDSDSAEDVTNYKIDGNQLTKVDANNKAVDENSAVAHADGDHVIITFANARKQYDTATFTVKTGIMTEDKQVTIPEKSQDLTFKDGETPTLKSVKAEGNSQLTVEFSEAVNMKTINDLKDKFKIDGKSLSNFGVNTGVNGSEIKDNIIVDNANYGPVGNWSSKVLFYLDSRIESGSHTLTISSGEGNKGLLTDAAAYPFQEKDEKFEVGTESTAPVPTKIEETSSGEVHLTFDRSMDVKTAKDLGNYKINGKLLSDISGAAIKTSDDDKLIKLKHITGGVIKPGSNTIYISDDIKDAFGNYVPKDTTKSFEDKKDETKPTVVKLEAIDNETIHVKYSKDVDNTYATQKDNYVLKDEKGTDISEHIKSIANTSGNSDDASDYYIKLYKFKSTMESEKGLPISAGDENEEWRLTQQKYTLTIKNIRDTASTPNIMDDYPGVISNVNDTVKPMGTGIYKKDRGTGDKDKVVVYFSKSMDTSTLIDKNNYEFVNGQGESKALPPNTEISTGGDSKSAIIEFPSSYKVVTTGKTATGTTNDVTAVNVHGVKDIAGNSLEGYSFNNNNKIDLAVAGAQVKEKAIRTKYGSNYNDENNKPNEGTMWIDVQFTRSVENITTSDFTFGGVVPSTQVVDGDTVHFKFDKNDKATADDLTRFAAITGSKDITYANGQKKDNPTKIDLVKAQGNSLKLDIISTTSIDETGAKISINSDGSKATLTDNQAKIYNNNAGPRTTAYDKDTTDAGLWTAVRDNNGGKVYITFDSPLDTSNASPDDFSFSGNDGSELKATSAVVDPTHPNTVVFNFATTSKNFDKGFTGTIKVVAKQSSTLKAQVDLNYQRAAYLPSDNDIKPKNLSVTNNSSTTVDLTGLKASIATAQGKVSSAYTSDSWSAMQSKLTAAQTVVAKTDATQADVNAAKTALDAAITALVPASPDTVAWTTTPAYKGITSTVDGKVDATKVTKVTYTVNGGAETVATVNSDGTFSIDVSSGTLGDKIVVKAYNTDGKQVNSKEVIHNI